MWYEGAGTADRRWLHADERGSIIAVSNGSGAVTTINSYDEYGIPAEGNTGRFQYTGQTWLPDLGMYHYKARMYAPGLGRFLQADPIGYDDGMNMYGYVAGDPVNFIDPTGLGSWFARTICSVWEEGTCWTTWTYVLDAGDLSQIGGNHGLTLSPIGEGGGGVGGASPGTGSATKVVDQECGGTLKEIADGLHQGGANAMQAAPPLAVAGLLSVAHPATAPASPLLEGLAVSAGGVGLTLRGVASGYYAYHGNTEPLGKFAASLLFIGANAIFRPLPGKDGAIIWDAVTDVNGIPDTPSSCSPD